MIDVAVQVPAWNNLAQLCCNFTLSRSDKVEASVGSSDTFRLRREDEEKRRDDREVCRRTLL